MSDSGKQKLKSDSKDRSTLPAVEVDSVILGFDSDEGEQQDLELFGRFGSSKYEVLGVLGEGGMGRVLKVLDRDLDRTVAMKIIRPTLSRDKASVKRFIAEARSTGRLEHPNIVPLYEVGRTRKGHLYYTMRFVLGRSLQEVVSLLRREDEETQRRFSLHRLLQIFGQVCMAVDYAHTMGYIHRDLKPANIMTGEFGEVQVMDWGLASTLSEPGRQARKSHIAGTPAFMSPEQTLGDPGEMDFRSDIYGLGVILYQILSLRLPFRGKSLEDLIERIQKEPPPPLETDDPRRPVPPFLARIAEKCLAKAKQERYQTARQLHDAIQEYLDGEREYLRNKERADRKMEEALPLMRLYFERRSELDGLNSELSRRKSLVSPWEPLEKIVDIIQFEKTISEKTEEKGELFARITDCLYDALAILEGHAEARKALARLYWTRFVDAEKERNRRQMADYKRMVERFHGGSLDKELLGHGSMQLLGAPPGSTIHLARFQEQDFFLQPSDERLLGTTPIARFELPMGSYQLTIAKEGFETVVLPVVVNRNQEVSISCRLPRKGEVPEGFVYVPAGPFLCGGDSQALHCSESSSVHLEGFVIARFPVTFAEYLEYLRFLQQNDRRELSQRVPRNSQGEPYCEIDNAGGIVLVFPEVPGFALQMDFPVVGVSWYDANAYAKWKSTQDGIQYGLPSERQWEKAARGADGRFYPWGDGHLYSFCKNMHSRPGDPLPEPIGSFPKDVSPYGVRDLAGGVHDWCLDLFRQGSRQRVVRGGSWAYSNIFARCASRHWNAPEDRRPYIGFRLCVSPFPRSQD